MERESVEGRTKRIQKKLVVFFACSVLLAAGCSSGGMSKQEYRIAGIEALNAGSYEEAIRQFEEAIAHSNGFVRTFELDVLKYRAEAEFGMKDYASAAETYGILLEADKEREEYYYFLCMAQAKLGDLDAALESFQKGETIQKDGIGREEARLCLGNLLKEQGRAEEAVTLYESAVTAGSTLPELYNQLGLCYLEAERYEDALRAFEQGLSALEGRKAVDNADNVANTGNAGDTNNANNINNESCQQELMFNQAVSYEYIGEFATARERMEQYVAEYPEDEAAKRELTFLRTR